MKILKIFGVVVGIHVFALILIFANPGCSSTTKPPGAAETVAKADTPAPVSVPAIAPAPTGASSAPPLTVNLGGTEGRHAPTRPGSAPAPAVFTPEPVTGVTPTTTYTVVAGDNLSKIAKKVHISAAELAAVNEIKINATLRPGQKLFLPGKSMGASGGVATDAAAPAPAMKSEPAAARAPGEVLKHTVKSGETLGAIAKKYEVKVADIAVANNISDPAKIKPGQELIIPGWDPKSGAKAGKSGKSTSTAKKTEEPRMPPVEQPAVVQPTSPPIVPIVPADDNPIKPAPRP